MILRFNKYLVILTTAAKSRALQRLGVFMRHAVLIWAVAAYNLSVAMCLSLLVCNGET